MRGGILILLILFTCSCSDEHVHQENPAKDPFNMKDTLKSLAETATFPDHFYLMEQALSWADSNLEKGNVPPDMEVQIKYYLRPRALLFTGKIGEAITLVEELKKGILEEDLDLSIQHKYLENLNNLLAICHLRNGEEANCLQHHGASSCIFPLGPEAYHEYQEGSRNAINTYLEILKNYPEDYQSIWLLNLAYMTLGQYPEKVPAAYYIDVHQFDAEKAVPKFKDIASETGVNAIGLVGGACVDDFNNDGLLDVVTSFFRLDNNIQYYTSSGDGTYLDQTIDAGLEGITGGININHADYNNDGYLDIFVMRGGWLGPAGKQPNSLLKNDGDGTFTDVTDQAGLLSYGATLTASWGDFNNDGWIDLFVGNESVQPGDSMFSQLYQSNGDGTFKEVSKPAMLYVNSDVKGSSWGDYNNDGLLDLFVSCYGSSNLLFRNKGEDASGQYTFEETAEEAGVSEPLFSFPTFLFDFNNDGFLDIYISSYPDIGDDFSVLEVGSEYLGKSQYKARPYLYKNNQDGTFREVAVQMNLDRNSIAMGLNFGDIDNDGYLDIYTGTGGPDLRSLMPNLMFRNKDAIVFEDVTASGGFGHLQKSHGIAFADMDNDGDQDIYMSVGGFFSTDVYPNVLFQNPGNDNTWITLVLEGTTSNRSAIGVKIKITIDENGTEREIHRVVSTGGSFGASSLQQEIGLRLAQVVKELEIYWPASGETQKFSNLEINSSYAITEGKDVLVKLTKEKIEFNKAKKNSHESHQH